MSDSVCIISTRAPYCGQFAREALDAVLVSASYEVPTTLLLMGDGVLQLLKGQNPGDIPRKNLFSMLQALPLYGIETIYVEEASLQERGLPLAALHDGITVLESKALPSFLQRHAKVLTF